MTEHLDGNVLGGAFGELFAVDITTAQAQCSSCGTRRAVAEPASSCPARAWWPGARPAARS